MLMRARHGRIRVRAAEWNTGSLDTDGTVLGVQEGVFEVACVLSGGVREDFETIICRCEHYDKIFF